MYLLLCRLRKYGHRLRNVIKMNFIPIQVAALLSKYPELHGHALDDRVRKLFVGQEPQFLLVVVQVAQV